MSGRSRSSRQSATRRASPPESVLDVLVAGRDAEGVHRHLDRPVQLPAADGLDGVLEAPLLRQELLHLGVRHGLGEPGADLLEPSEEVPGRRHALLDVAEDGLRRIEPRLLREIADPDAVGRARLAQEVRVDAGHDAEQRRLAGAVRPEHADLGAGEEREIDAAEDLALGRDDLPEIAHGEDVLGRHGATYDTRRGGAEGGGRRRRGQRWRIGGSSSTSRSSSPTGAGSGARGSGSTSRVTTSRTRRWPTTSSGTCAS